MALCKHTLHQGSNPKPVKFVSTASNLCHYTKEHMCLMIQSKTSEKPQKVSLLFRVKEILFYLSDPTIICAKFTMSITFQILVSMFV